MRQFRFSPPLPETPAFTRGDAIIVLGITTILYAGVRLAFRVPVVIVGPDISLAARIALVHFAFRWTDDGCVLFVHVI